MARLLAGKSAPATNTIADAINQAFHSLTRAERQLANKILENHPVSGLGTITQIAEKSGVSPPTIVRMVKKLGFKGFPQFQTELRRELEAKIAGPIAKHDNWAQKAPDSHILNRFAEAVIDNIRQSLSQIETETFDASCKLLSETRHSLYIIGGRITRALADYFFLHMQVIRKDVTHIQPLSYSWPHYFLDIKKGDVLVIFDIRRYENSTLKLAEMGHERGAQIILFTDQWRSPVEKFSKYCFSAKIVVPSAWDSTVELLLLVETFIAAIQELTWPETRARMEELEDMFDRTRFFRKFT
ncbi:MAG: MurR/RpiR family transcriptional regulator [Proteobacteria bacterium]|nr:MurR/RpiR family transcriptional regulator [Pseudomonadota bacterium]